MPTDSARPLDGRTELSLTTRLLLFGLLLFLLDSLCLIVADGIIQAVHFYAWFCGTEAVEQAPGPHSEVMRTRMMLWAGALAFPLWVGCVALILGRVKAVPVADIGLTLHRFGRDVLIGLATALVLTPLVLGLNLGAGWLSETALGVAPTEHPLSVAGQRGLLPIEWGLLAFAVMLAAPVREELLFRGVLQRLFITRRWGGHVAMALALLIALSSSVIALVHNADDVAPLSAFMPVLFILVMVPIYFAVYWRGSMNRTPRVVQPAYPDVEPISVERSKRGNAPAVFATALLFGAVHSFAWPTPIALFVLGLGLGYLALRTRSLVAPIVVHAVFNGTSFVLLLMGFSS